MVTGIAVTVGRRFTGRKLMVKVGDKIYFGREISHKRKTKNKDGKRRKPYPWRVKWVGPDGKQRYVIITQPRNNRDRVAFLIIDLFYQQRTKDPEELSKSFDTEEEWERLMQDMLVGRRVFRTWVDIADVEGLNDGPDRGDK